MGFSERFARKEAVALQRLGDPAVYFEQGQDAVDTFVIIDDVVVESEIGVESVIQVSLSRVLHTNVKKGDEVTCMNKTYRLQRKLSVEGTLISFIGLEV